MSNAPPVARQFGPSHLAKRVGVWLVFAGLWLVAVRWYCGDWGVLKDWFIGPTMLLGSLIAGATAEGGGAVAFPVLTLVFEIDPPVARDFSLMIQSVGMTAASVAIVRMRLTVDWRAIRWALVGAIPGMVISLHWIAPRLPADYAKMAFVSFWLAFAFVLFRIQQRERTIGGDRAPSGMSVEGSSRQPDRNQRMPQRCDNTPGTFAAMRALIACGVVGGIVTGVAGCGLDITIFSLIVLGYRVNEAVATRSSVIMMAAASLFGFAYKHAALGMQPDAWAFWQLAVPVVIVGAPLGAWLVRNRSRRFIARILIVSILVQFLAALAIIPLDGRLLLFSISAWCFGFLLFFALDRLGRTLRFSPSWHSPHLA